MIIKKIYKHISVILLLLAIYSCTPSKEIIYFQDIQGSTPIENTLNYEPRIQHGDMLSIHVSTVDVEAVIPFNLMQGTGTNSVPMYYMVDVDGIINFPVLGELNVGGFTIKELIEDLRKRLEVYLKNPIVNIRVVNFKVTVLGEVKNPGSYQVRGERISIVDAIGLAGDLTIQGNRKSVTLIREQNGKRAFMDIDLTSKRLFSSPYFYLVQNDVLYIPPNKSKINSSGVGPNAGILISAISALISLIAILTR